MKKLSFLAVTVAVAGLIVFACEKSPNPVEIPLAEQIAKSGSTSSFASKTAETTPSPLVTVTVDGSALEFWPFTGTDFSGTPQDPINLVFVGQADPRALRAALLFLDGDRTAFGFPNEVLFNSTWRDAIGGVQTAFANPEGWVGSAIQLELGPYDPIRFHLRFFDVGDFTLGGSHFEVLIPNTTDHQVISWELAEQLIAVDFIRSGLLAAGFPQSTGPINPSPSFKDIPAIIYNGLPVALRDAIGGPLGNVSNPVPIATNGEATILKLAGSVQGEAVVATQDFVINFNQVIPKPFCASSPFDLLLVQGPVNFRQKVIFTPSGNFISQFHALGHLDVTPLDALGNPAGESYRARVNEHHKGIVTDHVTLASSFQMFIEIPPTGPFRGRLNVKLQVGPGKSNQASLDVECLP